MYHLEFLVYVNGACQMDYFTIDLTDEIFLLIKDDLDRKTGRVSSQNLYQIVDKYYSKKAEVGSIVYCFLRKNLDY